MPFGITASARSRKRRSSEFVRVMESASNQKLNAGPDLSCCRPRAIARALRRSATVRHRTYRRRSHPCFRPDRKSTRLNSSHVEISYAVFCLKKKKKKKITPKEGTQKMWTVQED